MKTKLLIIPIVILTIGIMVYSLTKSKSITDSTMGNNKIQVAASFYPLYFFAYEIGKDKANVFSVTPNGIEPHDYEPKPQDIVKIQKSKILFINGASFEPWAEKIQNELKETQVNIIDTTKGLKLHPGTPEANDYVKKYLDPHVWLSPMLAKEQIKRITEGYIKADPNNKDFYEKNATNLKAKIDALHNSFQHGLQYCQKRDFVTSHAAFGYLANTYNLKQRPISGLSPEEEPSAAKLAEITSFVKENKIEYIFFETLISSDLSETIARETGAKTLVLDPIEGINESNREQGKNYFAIMKDNLINLQKALNCSK